MTARAIILTAAASVFCIMAIGAMARRWEWLTHEADESLLKLLIRLLTPCLIFSVIIDNPALRQAENLIWPPLVGFSMVTLTILIARLIAGCFGRSAGFRESAQRRTFALAAGLQNYGYIPIPLIQMLFDKQTVGVLFVHNVGVELALWTIGVVVLTGGVAGGGWKRAINPPSVAVVIALAINGLELQHQIPAFLFKTIEQIGQASIPIGLIFVGATIADHLGPIQRKGESAMQVSLGCALRLLLLPALMLLVTWALPWPMSLKRVLVVEAAMPAASFPIILAKHYGGDAPTALRIILSTSVLALVTVPLWIEFGLWLVGLGIGG